MSNWKLSDSGPSHELHIYDSKTGQVIWKAKAFGNKERHKTLLKIANEIIKKGVIEHG